MAKTPPKAVIQFQAIDDAAHDGRIQFLADDKLFALGRWTSDGWVYPKGEPLDFTPRYYRPASAAIEPSGGAGG